MKYLFVTLMWNARDRILLHQLADAFRAEKLIGTFHGIHLTFPF